jgi:hypothetical protein
MFSVLLAATVASISLQPQEGPREARLRACVQTAVAGRSRDPSLDQDGEFQAARQQMWGACRREINWLGTLHSQRIMRHVFHDWWTRNN